MLTEQNLKILEKAGENISKNQAQTKKMTPPSISQPVNTRVTDIQTRPVAAPIPTPQRTMPTAGLQERIAQSNQLDQFIPVR